MSEYAGVHLLDNPYFLDKAFDYFIPPDLRHSVEPGDFVTVPFGTANRRRMGLVVSLKDQPDNREIGTKPILSVCDRRISLNEEMAELCFFVKEQTLCTVGDAVRAMIPASALSRLEEVYLASDRLLREDPTQYSELDAPTLLICELIRKKGSVRFDLLKSRFGPAAEPAVKKLLSRELLIREFEVRQTAEKVEYFTALALPRERADAILKGTDTALHLRSAKQLELLRHVVDSEAEEHAEKDLLSAVSATSAQLSALYDKGILRRIRRQLERNALPTYEQSQKPLCLNEEQTAAYETLCALADDKDAKAALLHGVTGSGKTSVMMKLIDHVLQGGKGVILLLPEIALTPQTLSIFCSRYGERVAIIHSGLSAGERLDTYRRIRRGDADVVIGTRSAVFAPIERLGAIIIDEEQEHTYKSDMNPKYHAKDIARFRCAHNNALMLLASATPSFESFYRDIGLGDILDSLFNSNPISTANVPEIDGIFKKVFELCSSGKPENIAFAHGYVTELIHWIYSHCRDDKTNESKSTLQKMLDIINARDGLTSLAEIAKALYMDKHYLCHYFKSKTGITLSAYLSDKVYEKSCRLLKSTPYSIEKISGMCGFSSAACFSRFFKLKTGVTPSKYRAQNSMISLRTVISK